jgi:cytochrome b pre-mRNA-processing protein 3
LRPGGRDDVATRGRALYRTAVAAAREPALYRELGVPDTTEARFEMVAIHTALLARRLHREGEAGAGLAQAVVEAMTEDMDRSVRELGIGDLSVGRYVKRMTGSLMARWQVLDAALPQGDLAALETMLARNLFPDRAGPEAGLGPLARRVATTAAALDAAPAARAAELGLAVAREVTGSAP